MDIQIDPQLAKELLRCLMRPEKDREDHCIYSVNVTLAGEVRKALMESGVTE